MTSSAKLPVVILGGFLSPGKLYSSMKTVLQVCSGREICVVDTHLYNYIAMITTPGWRIILDKLDRTVRKVLLHSEQGKIILIGHSQGGVLARLYLSSEPFFGRNYNGSEHVARLVTLGSPHNNLGGIDRGGPMSRWIDQRVPGAYYSPQISYISVAGKYRQGKSSGTKQERFSARVYKQICGDAGAWGDVITPVSSALLDGSEHVVLEGVSHYSIFGEPWYGSEAIVSEWCRYLE